MRERGIFNRVNVLWVKELAVICRLYGFKNIGLPITRRTLDERTMFPAIIASLNITRMHSAFGDLGRSIDHGDFRW